MCGALKRLVVGIALLPALIRAGSGAEAAATRTISFSSSQPTKAVTVPANFVGFGCDAAFLNSYDNEFSQNLLSSVADRMSAPPTFRVGGTSGDRLLFNPNQKSNTTCISGDCPNGSGATYVIGPSYFEGFKGYKSVDISFQTPLSAKINSSNIQDYVTRAYQALGADKVAAIAIGNEVAGYDKTAAAYVAAVKTVEQIVINALNLTDGSEKIFEVLDLADGTVDAQNPWTLPDAFNQGINNNSLTKYAAEHWYQTNGGGTIQANLMNHSAITHKFINFGKSLSYLQANDPKIPYVLSETGSALGGTNAFSDRFGACLWSVDFQLFSMSQGVARVDGTGRPAANHSLFIPTSGAQDNPTPEVRAPYYAQPFIADFIGKTNGTTGVVNMDLSSDFLTAYAAYEGNKLARVALVNLHEYTASSGASRGNQTFAVNVPSGVQSVQVGKLTAKAGAEAGGIDNGGQNISWAGQQWSFSVDNGKGHPSTASTSQVKVANGVALVNVEDTEAVIVYI